MKTRLFILSLILFTGSFALNAQSLDKILDKYYDVIGIDKLLTTNSIVMRGKIIQTGTEIPTVMYQERPKKMRMEAEIPDGTKFIQAYDGKEGWAIMPWTGSQDPQAMTEEQQKALEQMGDIEGDLYNWKKKGYDVTLEGTEKLDGADVYKIKLVKPSGDEYVFYLDKNKHIILKEDAKVNVQGTKVETNIYFSDFRPVDGMTMPFNIQTKKDGQLFSQFIIEDIEVNQDIDDSLFEKPGSSK